ncbi:MAG: hypothetical protein LBU17_00975 [Treponema sp.]|nr:hypothetical protein [Treponema sp.]
MSNGDKVFKFVKVEDYFSDYRRWQCLGDVQACRYVPEEKAISLRFVRETGEACVMLVQIASRNTVRFRFGPGKKTEGEYSEANTRSIIMDRFKDLVAAMTPFTCEWDDSKPGQAALTVKNVDGKATLKVSIDYAPFKITVSKIRGKDSFTALETVGVYFMEDGEADYKVVQAFKKPASASYIGFGEQGGHNLAKNVSQLNYFNYDNMRYRQVYGRGPLECREPLYHSDPFFMEFNAYPRENFVNGVFVDNPSQILMDIGYTNSSTCLIGTRFWDSDIYLFAGDDAEDVMKTFMSFIGTPKLKPRYALGYHQGCYGYETREDVERVADDYRHCGIPLDGIHIDVDIQNQYQTFTINEANFPNPKEMFGNLAKRGIKCSTNITPVISSRDPNYRTYREGEEQGYFVKDRRTHLDDGNARRGQDFGGGSEYYLDLDDHENNINSGKSYIGEVNYGGDWGTPGHYADLNRKEVRTWWGAQYQYLFDCGLEMVWQDMTTPCIRNTRGDMKGFPFRLLISQDYYSGVGGKEHKEVEAIKVWNLYSYNLHKATYHGLNNLSSRWNKRNFIVGRGSFTGMHRFAALWTGDNASEWDFLKINVAQVLSLGMSGQAMSGEDIGGFEREADWQKWVDPELLIRWTAAGAFLPWFRNHYIGRKKGAKLFQEPYEYQNLDLDAWNVPYEQRYLYAAVLPVCKHYIKLRYRLMQLFYDALFENTLNGLPICRPLFLNCGEDKALFNDKASFLSNEFFVRKDLLIAPVLDKESPENGHGKRDVYLPQGHNWYAYMDNKRPLLPAVEGGSTVRDYDAHVNGDAGHVGFIVPMYVREGAIIPTLNVEQYVGEFWDNGMANPVTLNIYPGKSGSYTMYLDDGVSRSSAREGPSDRAGKSEYRETKVSHRYTGGKAREITIERVHDNYTPKYEKFLYVAVLHAPEDGEIKSVGIAGKSVPCLEGGLAALENSDTNAWAVNGTTRISYVKVFDDKPLLSVTLNYK